MSKERKSLNTVYVRRGKWVTEYISFEGKQKIKILKKEDGGYPKSKAEAKILAHNYLVDLHSMEHLRSEEEYLHRVAERKQLIQRIRFTLDDVLRMISTNPRFMNNTRLQTREFQWIKFRTWMKQHYPKINAPYEITGLMVDEFMSELYGEGMANSTYNNYVCSYKMFFNLISGAAGLGVNPFAHVQRLPRNDNISHRPIPKEFIPLIINACDDPQFSVVETRELKKISTQELKTLVIVGLCTGMRLKDCSLLDWSSVDFERNYIQTVAYKTRRYNKGHLWIPMMGFLRSHLLSIFHGENDGPIMPLIASRYIDEERRILNGWKKSDNGNLCGEVKNLLKFVGLPVTARLTKEEHENGVEKHLERRKKSPNLYGFHSFRHFFVSVCAENNVPIAYVETIIGTNSAVLKAYYTHVDQEDMMRAISRIECKFVGGLQQPKIPLACNSSIKNCFDCA